MKKINGYIYVLAVVALYACSAPDKKTQLIDLKKQRDEIASQITALEKAVAKEGGDMVTQKSAVVMVEAITPKTFTHYLEIQGKIDSDQNVKISPKSGGVVQGVFVERGQVVTKGTLLAQIDASTTLSAIGEVKKALELSTEIFAKQQRLWDSKIGTEVQYLQSKNQKESLEKKLITLNEQYELSRIRAPFNGSIDEIFVRIGEATSPGFPAFRIVSNSNLKAVAEVPESYINSVKKGNEVLLFLPDSKKEIVTKIQTAANVIDPINRTFKVEMALGADSKSLKTNMIAYVNIKDYKKENAITVPINIIQRTEKGNFVYVVEGKTAKMIPVTLGLSYQSEIEVLSGVTAGDKVITTGYQDVVDGQPVLVKDKL